MAKIATTLFFAMFSMLSSTAWADVPVFLKIDSRFPSGVHAREWLETRTQETQVQRWFRVSVDGAFGWLAEDHVLTDLKLSSIARMRRDEPDRNQPMLDAITGRKIPENAQVIILEIAGSWARGRVLEEDAPNQDSWILTEALKRDPGAQLERGVTVRETGLRVTAGRGKPALSKLPAFKEVSVLNSATTKDGKFLEIQTDHGSAWVSRVDVWLAEDLAKGSLRPLHFDLELRSSPLPHSDIVKRLKGTETLKIVSSKLLRWGKVKVPGHGWLWWPISEDDATTHTLPPLKLSAQDLFARKIYDMAASESVPGLRFASAKGLFKSRDGIEWSMIPKFNGENYPIAIAKSGTVFVGPYVSMDQGENFEQWIRWDRLIETVKRETGSPAARVRLSKLTTRDQEGKALELAIDIGRLKPIRVSTPDRGLTWRVL